MLENSVEKLAENIQEMCSYGASVSDLFSVLEPYYKAELDEIEKLAENIQEMCSYGASASDLISVLEPHFKAK